MEATVSIMLASVQRMSGPSQRDGRSARARGSAAQAPMPHPLEYPLYDAV